VIVATDREAHYVLDEILGNATDLPITEHATDTHGVTLVNFALFDLVGAPGRHLENGRYRAVRCSACTSSRTG
jgi:TnpA family transposase